MNKNIIFLYKAGKFYSAFGDNALILHSLFAYKYISYKQSVGFPESAFNKVIGMLQKEKISYKVYEKEKLICEYKGIDKNYKVLLKKALNDYDIEKRMERIREKINNFSLEELEKIIEGIEDGIS